MVQGIPDTQNVFSTNIYIGSLLQLQGKRCRGFRVPITSFQQTYTLNLFFSCSLPLTFNYASSLREYLGISVWDFTKEAL